MGYLGTYWGFFKKLGTYWSFFKTNSNRHLIDDKQSAMLKHVDSLASLNKELESKLCESCKGDQHQIQHAIKKEIDCLRKKVNEYIMQKQAYVNQQSETEAYLNTLIVILIVFLMLFVYTLFSLTSNSNTTHI